MWIHTPVQLLMNRRTKCMPISNKLLKPQTINNTTIQIWEIQNESDRKAQVHIQLKHNGAICRRNHQALQKSTANKSQITPFDVDFIVDQKKYNICNIQFPGIPCRPFSNNQSRSRHKYKHTQTSQTSITSALRHTVWATDKRNKRFYDNQWVRQLWTSQRCYKCNFCHHTMVKIVYHCK